MMLHVVASKPLDVNVEVTVNGVKVPIDQGNHNWPGNPPDDNGNHHWPGNPPDDNGNHHWPGNPPDVMPMLPHPNPNEVQPQVLRPRDHVIGGDVEGEEGNKKGIFVFVYPGGIKK